MVNEEASIIDSVLAGDLSAFALLVDRYKDLAITLAQNILLQKEDAEDVVQEAFIKTYTALATFKRESKFSTWFYRIVLNTALNRRKCKKLRVEEASDHMHLEEAILPVDLTGYNHQQQKKFITRGLLQLNDSERLCITLFYLHELSIIEIRELTGYSTANIKVLLYRGRKHLYNALEGMLQKEIKDLI